MYKKKTQYIKVCELAIEAAKNIGHPFVGKNEENNCCFLCHEFPEDQSHIVLKGLKRDGVKFYTCCRFLPNTNIRSTRGAKAKFTRELNRLVKEKYPEAENPKFKNGAYKDKIVITGDQVSLADINGFLIELASRLPISKKKKLHKDASFSGNTVSNKRPAKVLNTGRTKPKRVTRDVFDDF